MSKTKVQHKGKACKKGKGKLRHGCRWLKGRKGVCTCTKKGAKKSKKKGRRR